ncbi:hypothetical protein CISG_03954 [Coccidioides immitis RMSCC 3703]|uniref:Uncharacterized protein n=2 Tax=Coccidioides immitis TaxID=5501 RepID=A0A0J8QNE9_COCIT|nr:hypothetical protein CIRG_03129 [Coccidioides immitis RMSCC 2394]KMU73976.1 hypothetical protein CISG_03954 [Coccidioides immitis RMSCC 3703]
MCETFTKTKKDLQQKLEWKKRSRGSRREYGTGTDATPMCRVQSLRNDHSYKNAPSLSVGRLLVRLEELHVIMTLCMPSVKTKTWHSLNKPERLQASEPSYEKVSKPS